MEGGGGRGIILNVSGWWSPIWTQFSIGAGGQIPFLLFLLPRFGLVLTDTRDRDYISGWAAAAEQFGPFRGRLDVSDSTYESPYDSVHNLHTKSLGFKLSLGHPPKLLVNTYQKN
jgi:hypothetical protein